MVDVDEIPKGESAAGETRVMLSRGSKHGIEKDVYSLDFNFESYCISIYDVEVKDDTTDGKLGEVTRGACITDKRPVIKPGTRFTTRPKKGDWIFIE